MTVWLVDWVLVIASHCFSSVGHFVSSVRRLYINLRSFSLFWDKIEEEYDAYDVSLKCVLLVNIKTSCWTLQVV